MGESVVPGQKYDITVGSGGAGGYAVYTNSDWAVDHYVQAGQGGTTTAWGISQPGAYGGSTQRGTGTMPFDSGRAYRYYNGKAGSGTGGTIWTGIDTEGTYGGVGGEGGALIASEDWKWGGEYISSSGGSASGTGGRGGSPSASAQRNSSSAPTITASGGVGSSGSRGGGGGGGGSLEVHLSYYSSSVGKYDPARGGSGGSGVVAIRMHLLREDN